MNRRSLTFAFLSVAIGVSAFLLIAEGICRILPVSDGLMALPVNEKDPVLRFFPNRELTWSRDWNFSIVNRIRVNNAGYVNNQDYEPDGGPLMAIVGDSYVEAAMVPYGDTLSGRAADHAADAGRVYSFAASGAPLSQYLVWAKAAKARWGANALVIVVVSNDFDESLLAYKSAPGFHYYARRADGRLALRRVDYAPSRVRRLLRKSAFFRYLALNLQAPERLKRLVGSLIGPARADTAQTYIGNLPATVSEKRVRDSRQAIDAFLADLSSKAGWAPADVLFLVDGIRYPKRAPELASSYFGQVRRHFTTNARDAGFGVIDLDPAFFARHRAEASRFEFPTDAHWNAIAHGIAANALLTSSFYADWSRSASDRGGTQEAE